MDKVQFKIDNGAEFNAMTRGRGGAKAELKIENGQLITEPRPGVMTGYQG